MTRRVYGRGKPVKPRADWDDGPVFGGAHSIVVHEEEGAEWVESGLLFEDGSPIMVLAGEPKAPIGFLWHDENGDLRPREWFDEDSSS